jgi:hypothetical protein
VSGGEEPPSPAGSRSGNTFAPPFAVPFAPEADTPGESPDVERPAPPAEPMVGLAPIPFPAAKLEPVPAPGDNLVPEPPPGRALGPLPDVKLEPAPPCEMFDPETPGNKPDPAPAPGDRLEPEPPPDAMFGPEPLPLGKLEPAAPGRESLDPEEPKALPTSSAPPDDRVGPGSDGASPSRMSEDVLPPNVPFEPPFAEEPFRTAPEPGVMNPPLPPPCTPLPRWGREGEAPSEPALPLGSPAGPPSRKPLGIELRPSLAAFCRPRVGQTKSSGVAVPPLPGSPADG